MTILLTGLDGSNTLGFLAGLGVLRVLDGRAAASGEARPRLSWTDDGRWRAVMEGPQDLEEIVVAVLEDQRSWSDEPALALAYTKDGAAAGAGEDKAIRDLKPPPAVMRSHLEGVALRAAAGQRRSADLSAAFGTDIAVDNKGNVKPSALHFTAGQQRFLEMASALQAGVSRADIVEALEGPWTCGSKLPSFSWDSTAARFYALRATDPSSEKRGSDAGANWLALLGMAFFPLAARGVREPRTPCVGGGWKTGFFTWPLWRVPATQATVQSLLSAGVSEAWTPSQRAARGISAVFQSAITRSEQGGYGAFSPAVVK